MANYTVALTRALSATLTVGELHASAAVALRRFAIYDITIGVQGPPTSFANLWVFQNFTAPGVSTPVVPQAVDPADSGPVLTEAGQNNTVEPTYVVGAVRRSIPLNQQATYRWAATREDQRLVSPAIDGSGIGVHTPSAGSAGIAGTVELMFND